MQLQVLSGRNIIGNDMILVYTTRDSRLSIKPRVATVVTNVRKYLLTSNELENLYSLKMHHTKSTLSKESFFKPLM